MLNFFKSTVIILTTVNVSQRSSSWERMMDCRTKTSINPNNKIIKHKTSAFFCSSCSHQYSRKKLCVQKYKVWAHERGDSKFYISLAFRTLHYYISIRLFRAIVWNVRNDLHKNFTTRAFSPSHQRTEEKRRQALERRAVHQEMTRRSARPQMAHSRLPYAARVIPWGGAPLRKGHPIAPGPTQCSYMLAPSAIFPINWCVGWMIRGPHNDVSL